MKRDSEIYQWYLDASLSSVRSRIGVHRNLQLYPQLYPIHPDVSAIIRFASCRGHRFMSDHHRMSGAGYHEQAQDGYAYAEI